MESLFLLKQYLCSGPHKAALFMVLRCSKPFWKRSSSTRVNSSFATTHSFLKLLHRRNPAHRSLAQCKTLFWELLLIQGLLIPYTTLS